jgi:drug/metabolite transporter (DMT)-like permease
MAHFPVTPRHRTDLLAGVALVVMWSSGFIGAALGTSAAAADTLLAWRYLAAATVLGALMAARRPRLPRGALTRQGVIGLLVQVGYLGGVVSGVGFGVPAGTAALVAALQPLVVATAAGPLLGERTDRRQTLGLLAGLAGVALVVSGDLRLGTAPAWSYLLPLAGMAALSAGTLVERRVAPRESLLDALTLQTFAATAVFAAETVVTGRFTPPADATFWWAVVWTVVLSTFGGYGSYLLVLRRGGANRVSTLLYLTPPTTMLWAFWMFEERPGAPALVGVLVSAAGVYAVLAPPRRPRHRQRPPAAQAPAVAAGKAPAADEYGEITCKA